MIKIRNVGHLDKNIYGGYDMSYWIIDCDESNNILSRIDMNTSLQINGTNGSIVIGTPNVHITLDYLLKIRNFHRHGKYRYEY